MLNNNTEQEILQDGEKRDWKGKKEKSLKTDESLVRLKEYGRAFRMKTCGDFLVFNQCQADGYKKLKSANFCRDRMCPMCNWRRSLMLHSQIMKVLHESVQRQPIRFIFLTLTVKNVNADDLSQAITDMFDGFKQLFQYKDIDKSMIGWIRNLEVTYNEKEDTFHPHFHVLMGVQPSYFNKGKYISQDKWTEYWAKAMDLDYIPVVNVKAVKAKHKGQTVESAVAETAKYSVKDTDYLKDSDSETDKLVFIFMSALKGRRLIGFGKLFRKVKRELKLGDAEAENADLVGENEEKECKCPVCQGELREYIYNWDLNVRNYIRHKD